MKENQQFLKDIKMVRECLVYCLQTNKFFKVRKHELLEASKTSIIKYYITDKIFVVKRNSMIIL